MITKSIHVGHTGGLIHKLFTDNILTRVRNTRHLVSRSTPSETTLTVEPQNTNILTKQRRSKTSSLQSNPERANKTTRHRLRVSRITNLSSDSYPTATCRCLTRRINTTLRGLTRPSR